MNHFDYVKCEDLEKIGLGPPAARRLLDAVKKKKSALWRRNLVAKFLLVGGSQGNKSGKSSETSAEDLANEDSLARSTCLIQEKVSNTC